MKLVSQRRGYDATFEVGRDPFFQMAAQIEAMETKLSKRPSDAKFIVDYGEIKRLYAMPLAYVEMDVGPNLETRFHEIPLEETS